MNSDIPTGWKVLVDELLARMDECGVDRSKLLMVREAGGYIIFMFGLLSFQQFHDVVDWSRALQVKSHGMCIECGKPCTVWSLTGLPLCLDHKNLLQGGSNES